MIVTLYRTKTNEHGTHGHLEDAQGNVLCYTIERSDDRLVHEGVYPCEPHVKSNNGQDCWILNHVIGRTGILIHTGNTEHDSEGCIIVGMLSNSEQVFESKIALQELKKKLPPRFTLRITSRLF